MKRDLSGKKYNKPKYGIARKDRAQRSAHSRDFFSNIMDYECISLPLLEHG